MSSSINISFRQLIDEEGAIRIPKIQRDYAQGRKVSKVERIRTDFLKSLLKVVGSDNGDECLRLDFVYGYTREKAFEPLDGQQRLTTLFLLHWLFRPVGNQDLLDEQGQSTLSYATRKTSESFCNKLVEKDAFCLISQWREAEDKAEKKYKEDKKARILAERRKEDPEAKEEDVEPDQLKGYVRKPFQDYVQRRDWFKWGWRYDPTIASMLTVIDTFLELFEGMNIDYDESKLSVYYHRLDRITFDKRNLDDLDQGDQLYVKMNARGKELSDYDKFKSSMEEEMQLQGLSGLPIEDNWKSCMDGKWLNYFWLKVKDSVDTSTSPKNTTVSKVYDAEAGLMRLLLRLIAIQYRYADENRYKEFENDARYAVGPREYRKFIELCFTTGAKFDDLFSSYSGLVWWMRENQLDFQTINFERVYEDMESLLYVYGNGEVHDVTEIGVQAWYDKSTVYLHDISSRQILVVFYAILAFVRRYPATAIRSNDDLKEDFKYWVRFIRDIVYPTNTYSRVDNIKPTQNAFKTIDGWLDEYDLFEKGASHRMCRLVSLMNPEKTHFGETPRIVEERLKAQLRLESPVWVDLLEAYENDPYFTGQSGEILVSWCRLENGEYDTSRYKWYSGCMKKFVDCGLKNGILPIQALLALRDYRQEVFSNCLGWFEKDKSRSFKQYMRVAEYSRILKDLFDTWKSSYRHLTDFSDFANKLIQDTSINCCDWRNWALKDADVLKYGWLVVIDREVCLDGESKGAYTFLAERKTADSRMKEAFLYFLLLQFNKNKDKDKEKNKDMSCELMDYRMMEWGQGEHKLIVKKNDQVIVEIGMSGNRFYSYDDKRYPANSVDRTSDVDVYHKFNMEIIKELTGEEG